MAQFTNISNSLFDSILPSFGSAGNNLPVWNEGQKMFISSEYESAAGNRYYKGLRFCEQLAIIEIVGLYHTWTYIDGIEIYAFDGKKPKLVGKRQYDKTFYKLEFIKEQTEQLVADYIHGQIKIQDVSVPILRVKEEAKTIVGRCYTSFLSDEFNLRLRDMIPLLCSSNNK